MSAIPSLGPHDYHVITDGKTNTEKVFDHLGQETHSWPCYPHGENGPSWHVSGGDTVPGEYLLGDPIWTADTDDAATVKRPYGWVFIPMIDFTKCEAHEGRAGIGNHGGGRWEDYWTPRQQLTVTAGCVRHHNQDVKMLAELVESTKKVGGKIWQTVTQ